MPHKLKIRGGSALFLLCCLLSCTLDGGLTRPKNATPSLPDKPQPDLSPVSALLEIMSVLPKGDPARQAELIQATQTSAKITPTTSNQLKWALTLATPGHSGSDPVAAQRQLSELLARPETLLPVERLLADVELKEVEQRLILQAENKRIREELPRDSREKLAVVNHRLAAETDENVRLRKALEEALAKLDAVSHVERSINDRGTHSTRVP